MQYETILGTGSCKCCFVTFCGTFVTPGDGEKLFPQCFSTKLYSDVLRLGNSPVQTPLNEQRCRTGKIWCWSCSTKLYSDDLQHERSKCEVICSGFVLESSTTKHCMQIFPYKVKRGHVLYANFVLTRWDEAAVANSHSMDRGDSF